MRSPSPILPKQSRQTQAAVKPPGSTKSSDLTHAQKLAKLQDTVTEAIVAICEETRIRPSTLSQMKFTSWNPKDKALGYFALLPDGQALKTLIAYQKLLDNFKLSDFFKVPKALLFPLRERFKELLKCVTSGASPDPWPDTEMAIQSLDGNLPNIPTPISVPATALPAVKPLKIKRPPSEPKVVVESPKILKVSPPSLDRSAAKIKTLGWHAGWLTSQMPWDLPDSIKKLIATNREAVVSDFVEANPHTLALKSTRSPERDLRQFVLLRPEADQRGIARIVLSLDLYPYLKSIGHTQYDGLALRCMPYTTAPLTPVILAWGAKQYASVVANRLGRAGQTEEQMVINCANVGIHLDFIWRSFPGNAIEANGPMGWDYIDKKFLKA